MVSVFEQGADDLPSTTGELPQGGEVKAVDVRPLHKVRYHEVVALKRWNFSREVHHRHPPRIEHGEVPAEDVLPHVA